MNARMVTPQELSRAIAVPGPAIRKYLRTHHADGHSDYGRWQLDDVQADAVHAYFSSGPDPHPTDSLADWSSWVPFYDAAKLAPTALGVYMFRTRTTSEVVYVRMAGERSGKGLRGRLDMYLRGRGAVSGFGEAALDRAFSDVVWATRRLELLSKSEGARTKEWAKAAIERANVQVRWSISSDAALARALESRVLRSLDAEPLWNRQRPKNTDFEEL